jgi:hypothetical protein
MKDQFLSLINNSNVHRVDLNQFGRKNTRDYADGIAHYSIGDNFKAEVIFTDKTERLVSHIIIKNKTFNRVVATFTAGAEVSAFKHALDNRVLITQLKRANAIKYHNELNRLTRRSH